MPATPSRLVQTNRLVLRLPKEEDAHIIFQKWAQDPDVTRFLTWRPHRSVVETEEFVQSCIAAWNVGTRFPWVITRRTDEELLGMIEIRRPLKPWNCVSVGRF